MAKNTDPAVAVRSAKTKTPAQLARRERNVAEAAERLRRLQEKQTLAKELRGKGYVGNDNAVIEKFMEDQRNQEAETYVANVLAVPVSGGIIKRWLKDRINQSPIHVKALIVGFLNRDGSKPGHKDNSHLKADVEEYLNSEQGRLILSHRVAA